MALLRFPHSTLRLDDGTGERGGVAFQLTETELEVVRALHAALPEPLSTKALLDRAWARAVSPGVIAVTIRRIRSKLELNPSRPTALVTARGDGYRLCLDPGPHAEILPCLAMAAAPWPVTTLGALTGRTSEDLLAELHALEGAGQVRQTPDGWHGLRPATADPGPLEAHLAGLSLEPVFLRPVRGLLEATVRAASGAGRRSPHLTALVHRLFRVQLAYGGDLFDLVETHLVGRLDPLAQVVRLEVLASVNGPLLDGSPARQALEDAVPSSAVGFAWVLHAAASFGAYRSGDAPDPSEAIAQARKGIAVLEPFDDDLAQSARLLGGAILFTNGEAETYSRLLTRIEAHAPLASAPTMHLQATFRRVEFGLCDAPAFGMERLRMLLQRYPHPDSAYWATAASWLGVLLLRQGEREEGLYWVDHSIDLLDQRLPALGSQMRIRAALCLLDAPARALALLPRDLHLESHTTRWIGRWIRAALGDASITLPPDLEALRLAFAEGRHEDSDTWPWIARALTR